MNTLISQTSFYKFRLFEIQIILFFAYMGILFIFNTDFISFFLAFELFSFSTILLTLYKYTKKSTNIAIIYFFINAISSIFILLGLYYYYKTFGITFINNEINFFINILTNNNHFSFYFFILGLIMKLGSAPFHFWVLPLYDSIPTIITLYQSILPKIFYFFIFFHFIMLIPFSSFFIYFLIFSSFIIGSFIGIYQSKIKKLLAASSIVNLGFFFLSFIPYNISHLLNDSFLVINPFIYFFLYFINVINIFSILLFFHDLSKLKQLSSIPFLFPSLSFFLIISIFSFIGIPPFAGFFAKIFVLANLIFNLNPLFISFILFSLIATVISAYYYLYFFIYTYNLNPYPFYYISSSCSSSSSIPFIIAISSLIIIIWPLFNIYIIPILDLFIY